MDLISEDSSVPAFLFKAIKKSGVKTLRGSRDLYSIRNHKVGYINKRQATLNNLVELSKDNFEGLIFRYQENLYLVGHNFLSLLVPGKSSFSHWSKTFSLSAESIGHNFLMPFYAGPKNVLTDNPVMVEIEIQEDIPSYQRLLKALLKAVKERVNVKVVPKRVAKPYRRIELNESELYEDIETYLPNELIKTCI